MYTYVYIYGVIEEEDSEIAPILENQMDKNIQIKWKLGFYIKVLLLTAG